MPERSETYNFLKKAIERFPHYRRLGFASEEIIQFALDDERWERAKKMPIDPNNGYDLIMGGLKGLTPRDLGRKERGEIFRKVFREL